VLYVSYACPWAHRTLLTRALKGLEDVIDVVVVAPVWGVVDEPTGRKSWIFSHPENEAAPGPIRDLLAEYPLVLDNDVLQAPEGSDLSDEAVEHLRCINPKNKIIGGASVVDTLHHKRSLREIYELNDPEYVGRYTVPVLFDKQTNTIVNTESAEIIQILDTAFQHLAKYPDWTLTPKSIPREDIEAACDKMYPVLNNGVYRAGFAQSQIAYLKAKTDVYQYLDYLNSLLENQRFICGTEFSEADIRAIVTLLRFDSVYISHFKLSAKRIADYQYISDYLADIWQNILVTDCAKKTFNETHIKYHYYCSHENINKFAIVPETTPIQFDVNVEYRSKLGQ